MAPLSHLIKRQGCYTDEFGQQACNGWSNGTRIGIGVAVAVGIFVLILLAGVGRKRRRAQQASQITPTYQVNPQQEYQTNNIPYNSGYENQQNTGNGQFEYQYPPTPSNQQKTYFAPPAGPPPPELEYSYPAPSVPPPSYHHKEGIV